MSWLDYCDTQETDTKTQAAVYLNRLNVDGTMGGLSEGIRQLPATTETDAPTEIYDTHGRRVPALGSKGVYLVSAASTCRRSFADNAKGRQALLYIYRAGPPIFTALSY